jgi:hypothetical protein
MACKRWAVPSLHYFAAAFASWQYSCWPCQVRLRPLLCGGVTTRSSKPSKPSHSSAWRLLREESCMLWSQRIVRSRALCCASLEREFSFFSENRGKKRLCLKLTCGSGLQATRSRFALRSVGELKLLTSLFDRHWRDRICLRSSFSEGSNADPSRNIISLVILLIRPDHSPNSAEWSKFASRVAATMWVTTASAWTASRGPAPGGKQKSDKQAEIESFKATPGVGNL